MLTNALMALAVVIFAAPAFAQTAKLQGKVVDSTGKGVPDVKITATELPAGSGQKWETKSDKSGNYIIGTIPKSGPFLVHAEKPGVGVDEQRATVKIGDFTNLNFTLSNKPMVSEAEAAKNQSIKKFFEDGVAAANANNHEAAIAAFTQAATAMPTCSDCYFNIGVSQTQLKNYDAAEAAYKKAIELRPAYPEAYNAMASMYTAQKKMDLAGAASTKAAELSAAAPGGGSAESMYSAGVGLFNANKFPEAQAAFEAALKSDPNYADAHMMLGTLYLRDPDKMPQAAAEFQAYLKLAPTGKSAAQAQAMLDAVKTLLPK